MTREEVIKGLMVHLDTNVNCDNCPAKYKAICFEMLIMEAVRLLEEDITVKSCIKASTGETPEANK